MVLCAGCGTYTGSSYMCGSCARRTNSSGKPHVSYVTQEQRRHGATYKSTYGHPPRSNYELNSYIETQKIVDQHRY